ncbi:MAG: ROK family protein [Phycisphaeraceae bacterium]|nr:ROK family protein [Phycisphaeraceae bacterium]
MDTAIGIDAGCTNVKVVAVDARGAILADVQIPSHNDGSHSASVKAALTQLLDKLDHRPTTLGIAAPGLPSPDARRIVSLPGRDTDVEGLDWTTFLAWPTPVPVLNDAQAALVAEAWCGAAAGCDNVVLLTLGTGVGGAMIVDGRLLRGHLGRAGHLGHISQDIHGPLGILNIPGPLEDQLGESTVKRRTHDRFTSNRDLLEAAQAGDSEAQQHWQHMIRSLAVGIASLINVADPQVVVIGGGVAASGDALFGPVRQLLSQFEWRPTGGDGVPIVPAALGRFAGAIGAARFAVQWNREAARHG